MLQIKILCHINAALFFQCHGPERMERQSMRRCGGVEQWKVYLFQIRLRLGERIYWRDSSGIEVGVIDCGRQL